MVLQPTSASSILLFHMDLFNDALLHVLIPSNCLASKNTASIHLSFGLPVGYLLCILPSMVLFGILWFSILCTLPTHFDLHSFMCVAIWISPNWSINSLNCPSTFISLIISLNIFLSNTPKAVSILLFITESKRKFRITNSVPQAYKQVCELFIVYR